MKSINPKCETHTAQTDIGIIDCHLPIRLSKSGRNKQWKYISNGERKKEKKGTKWFGFWNVARTLLDYHVSHSLAWGKNLCLIHMSHSVQLLFTPTTDFVYFFPLPPSLVVENETTQHTHKKSASARKKAKRMWRGRKRKKERMKCMLFFMWIPIGRKSFYMWNKEAHSRRKQKVKQDRQMRAVTKFSLVTCSIWPFKERL